MSYAITFSEKRDNRDKTYYWTGHDMNLCDKKDADGRPLPDPVEPKKYATTAAAEKDVKTAADWCKKNGCREHSDRLTVSEI